LGNHLRDLALAVENIDRLGEQCPNAPTGSTS
jgi:hypothetical protein